MKTSNMNIVNAFTSIDEMMQRGNGPLMLLSPKEMFEMGQFYEWSKCIVDNADSDLDDFTEVPEEFYWVVGETQGW